MNVLKVVEGMLLVVGLVDGDAGRDVSSGCHVVVEAECRDAASVVLHAFLLLLILQARTEKLQSLKTGSVQSSQDFNIRTIFKQVLAPHPKLLPPHLIFYCLCGAKKAG